MKISRKPSKKNNEKPEPEASCNFPKPELAITLYWLACDVSAWAPLTNNLRTGALSAE